MRCQWERSGQHLRAGSGEQHHCQRPHELLASSQSWFKGSRSMTRRKSGMTLFPTIKVSVSPTPPIRRPGLCLENRAVHRPKAMSHILTSLDFDNISFHNDFADQNQAIMSAIMSYTISTLLTRNLQDVFGENDPARRR